MTLTDIICNALDKNYSMEQAAADLGELLMEWELIRRRHERGQDYGTKSREHLSESVAGKSVVVEYNTFDRYGRTLGKVLVNGEDVNLERIEAGMAWHYKKYQGEQSASDRIKYSDAELEARRHKLGLWRDPNPVPPWDYRQAERDRRTSMEPFVGKSTVRGVQ